MKNEMKRVNPIEVLHFFDGETVEQLQLLKKCIDERIKQKEKVMV